MGKHKNIFWQLSQTRNRVFMIDKNAKNNSSISCVTRKGKQKQSDDSMLQIFHHNSNLVNYHVTAREYIYNVYKNMAYNSCFRPFHVFSPTTIIFKYSERVSSGKKKNASILVRLHIDIPANISIFTTHLHTHGPGKFN